MNTARLEFEWFIFLGSESAKQIENDAALLQVGRAGVREIDRDSIKTLIPKTKTTMAAAQTQEEHLLSSSGDEANSILASSFFSKNLIFIKGLLFAYRSIALADAAP